MASASSKKCGCGWVIGIVIEGQLVVYSEAIAGGGAGQTPVVLTVFPPELSLPIRCTHCGRRLTWNGSANQLIEVLEQTTKHISAEDEHGMQSG